mmetsp:Transcript_23077/g.49398  ORF Transcript_23077/g.49398 Transcript_23077/m.49398 type:complete len:239 (+) Transcript_23077:77-793(+)
MLLQNDESRFNLLVPVGLQVSAINILHCCIRFHFQHHVSPIHFVLYLCQASLHNLKLLAQFVHRLLQGLHILGVGALVAAAQMLLHQVPLILEQQRIVSQQPSLLELTDSVHQLRAKLLLLLSALRNLRVDDSLGCCLFCHQVYRPVVLRLHGFIHDDLRVNVLFPISFVVIMELVAVPTLSADFLLSVVTDADCDRKSQSQYCLSRGPSTARNGSIENNTSIIREIHAFETKPSDGR